VIPTPAELQCNNYSNLNFYGLIQNVHEETARIRFTSLSLLTVGLEVLILEIY
jgi:hypothetical protein